jgi:hypothetical protein
MTKYLSSLIALGAAAGVYYYNQGHADSKVFLVGLNLVFGDDPNVLAERTWQILLGVGIVWLGMDLMRAMRRKATDDQATPEA